MIFQIQTGLRDRTEAGSSDLRPFDPGHRLAMDSGIVLLPADMSLDAFAMSSSVVLGFILALPLGSAVVGQVARALSSAASEETASILTSGGAELGGQMRVAGVDSRLLFRTARELTTLIPPSRVAGAMTASMSATVPIGTGSLALSPEAWLVSGALLMSVARVMSGQQHDITVPSRDAIELYLAHHATFDTDIAVGNPVLQTLRATFAVGVTIADIVNRLTLFISDPKVREGLRREVDTLSGNSSRCESSRQPSRRSRGEWLRRLLREFILQSNDASVRRSCVGNPRTPLLDRLFSEITRLLPISRVLRLPLNLLWTMLKVSVPLLGRYAWIDHLISALLSLVRWTPSAGGLLGAGVRQMGVMTSSWLLSRHLDGYLWGWVARFVGAISRWFGISRRNALSLFLAQGAATLDRIPDALQPAIVDSIRRDANIYAIAYHMSDDEVLNEGANYVVSKFWFVWFWLTGVLFSTDYQPDESKKIIDELLGPEEKEEKEKGKKENQEVDRGK